MLPSRTGQRITSNINSADRLGPHFIIEREMVAVRPPLIPLFRTSSGAGSLYYDGSPDTDLSIYEYLVMEEEFFFWILVSQIVDRFPLILPDPSRTSLFDIVRFTFFNFNEER